MKILVVGLPRNQSHNFTNTLSKKLKITNHLEKYGNAINLIFNSPRRNFNLSDSIRTVHKNITKELFSKEDSFVIKLVPRYLLTDFSFERNEFDISSIINDLKSYFNIDNYDQIFLLKRQNLTDSFCSIMYATVTNSWHIYNDNQRVNSTILITDDEKTNKEIYKTVIERILLEKIEQYFIQNQISFIGLSDNEIEKYLVEHYSIDSRLKELPTKRDYSILVSNYSLIDQKIKQLYSEYKLKLNDFEFI